MVLPFKRGGLSFDFQCPCAHLCSSQDKEACFVQIRMPVRGAHRQAYLKGSILSALHKLSNLFFIGKKCFLPLNYSI